MNLELFPEDVHKENTHAEAPVDEVRPRSIEDLGLEDSALSRLTDEAKKVAGIVGKIPNTKGVAKKFANALWGLMQRKPEFTMEGSDQLIVFRTILARELPPEPQATPTPRKKKAPSAPPPSSADPSLRRKAYIDQSIEAANSPNPF